ncbi:Dbl homology (DH) domain [Phaffia rhodozyma]|uniref:Dbl homology (DH) domain n=1 Tax=Phaffia rhodozyma TaxID=264483 RepID=A0A0F7SGS2_PHARH|nr:Dbl homology (DH) domain [Phaffia rhodozyma]
MHTSSPYPDTVDHPRQPHQSQQHRQHSPFAAATTQPASPIYHKSLPGLPAEQTHASDSRSGRVSGSVSTHPTGSSPVKPLASGRRPQSAGGEGGTPGGLKTSSMLGHSGGSSGGSGRLLKRAFFCDIVLEDGRESDETNLFLSTLGDQLHAIPYPAVPSVPLSSSSAPPTNNRSSSETERSHLNVPGRMERSGSVDIMSTSPSLPNLSKLPPLLSELLSTEQTYVRRLRALKQTYADPLRLFSKDPSTAIIPVYNANQLFGNIDVIIKVNEAFLADLETVIGQGQHSTEYKVDTEDEWGIGDVALKHFKDLRAFDCYKTYYDKCEDAQTMFADMIVKRKQFADFVSASKYKTEGISNVGLRELLMEPVQRIPRYTMIWQLMIKHMSLSDPQRQKLVEATDIATAVATCEKDPHTKRMMVMMALSKSVDGFPAELINNNRDYLASVDVEDLPPEFITNSHASPASPLGNIATLHSTLYLFSDRILIAKRPSAGASGRKLTGLDDVARLWRGSVAPSQAGSSNSSSAMSMSSNRRSGDSSDGSTGKMSSKGLVGLLDLVVTDSGGGDFSVYLPYPPVDQSDRWSNRPFRSYTVVHPPLPYSIDPASIASDRYHFIQNVWAAQTLIRARGGKSLAFASTEEERLIGASEGNSAGECAKGFYNVWRRNEWEQDMAKSKVVIQVDESGRSTPLLTDDERAPSLFFRIQPLVGGLARVSNKISGLDAEEEITPTITVMSNIIKKIHQHDIYRPRLDPRSAPNTPSSHAVSRRPILGLDVISRNLFGSGSVGSKGSVSHRHSRSVGSKSSTMNSTATRSTTRSTMSSMTTYSDYHPREKSPTPRSPTSKSPRSKSPGIGSRGGSTSPYSARKPVPTDELLDGSEVELTERLELAKKNGQNMVEEVISSEAVEQKVEQVEVKQPVEVNRLSFDSLSSDRGGSISTRSSSRPKPPSTPSFATAGPLCVRNKTPQIPSSSGFEPLNGFGPTQSLSPSKASNRIDLMASPTSEQQVLSPSVGRTLSTSDSRRPMGPRRPLPSAKSTAVKHEDDEADSPSPSTVLKRDRAKSMESLSPSLDKKPRHFGEDSPRSALRPLETGDGGSSRAINQSTPSSSRVGSIKNTETPVSSNTLKLLRELEELRVTHQEAISLIERQGLELVDIKSENATLYDAFNEELEQMYSDMNLPGAESNVAMKRDLQIAKADRNALRLENASLRRELDHVTYEKNRLERLMKQYTSSLP